MYDHNHFGVMMLHEIFVDDAGRKFGVFSTVKDGISVNLPLDECHRLP